MPDQSNTGSVASEDRKDEAELQKTTSAVPTALKPDSQPTAANSSASCTNYARRKVEDGVIVNGDESDARMAEIEKILDHAALLHLDKCELVAEWVRHAEANAVSVFGQPDHKPQGGRPEGGIARAARALAVPGKTVEARRMFIRRALKIEEIWPEGKVAARAVGLHDNESALLAIAKEKTPEAQLEKVKELANRKAQRRSKNKSGVSERAATAETSARASGADSGSEIIGPQPVGEPELDKSKPASMAVLVEFAKFMLARLSQGEKIVLTLTSVEDVQEFSRLANRVRWVLGQQG